MGQLRVVAAGAVVDTAVVDVVAAAVVGAVVGAVGAEMTEQKPQVSQHCCPIYMQDRNFCSWVLGAASNVKQQHPYS